MEDGKKVKGGRWLQRQEAHKEQDIEAQGPGGGKLGVRFVAFKLPLPITACSVFNLQVNINSTLATPTTDEDKLIALYCSLCLTAT